MGRRRQLWAQWNPYDGRKINYFSMYCKMYLGLDRLRIKTKTRFTLFLSALSLNAWSTHSHNKARTLQSEKCKNKKIQLNKANKQLNDQTERRNVIYSCLRCSIIIVFMCHRSFPFSCNSNNNMRTFFSCCVLFFLVLFRLSELLLLSS